MLPLFLLSSTVVGPQQLAITWYLLAHFFFVSYEASTKESPFLGLTNILF